MAAMSRSCRGGWRQILHHVLNVCMVVFLFRVNAIDEFEQVGNGGNAQGDDGKHGKRDEHADHSHFEPLGSNYIIETSHK